LVGVYLKDGTEKPRDLWQVLRRCAELRTDKEDSMPLVLDAATFQKKCAGLSMVRLQAGENVLTTGTKTERLFVLRRGSVEVVKDGVQIAKVSAPGAVFGELAVLLDQPHTADVRTLEESHFYVANAATLLAHDSAVPLYVAAILARRLDSANQALVEVKRQLRAGERRSVIGKTVEKVEQLLSPSGDLVYPSHSYNPFAPD
jgi:CRP/FNR family transcriptional regulator, cyclic AMP receptor protein